MTSMTKDVRYGSCQDDTSILVAPSPHSTDRPSQDNLDEDYDNDVMPLILDRNDSNNVQLSSFQHSENDHTHSSSKAAEKKSGLTKKAVLGVTFLLAAIAAFFALNRYKGSIPSKGGEEIVNPTANRGPLSTLDPVSDLGLATVERPKSSRPPVAYSDGSRDEAIPTNAWYQNLLLVSDEPAQVHRAYAMPYVVDAAGPIAGIRVHPNHIWSSTTIIQLQLIEDHGLTLGASADAVTSKKAWFPRSYTVDKTTPLSISLRWKYFPMTSTIVKGMPYATVSYETIRSRNIDGEYVYPTIGSQIPMNAKPVADGKNNLTCGKGGSAPVLVEKEIKLYFDDSDFTWLVFLSDPAWVQCVSDGSDSMKLQVVDCSRKDISSENPFILRAALYLPCTTGRNPIYCHQVAMHPTALFVGQGEYGDLLRNYSHLYPGPNTDFLYSIDEEKNLVNMTFEWDVRNMKNTSSPVKRELMMFALPHHLDIMVDAKSPSKGTLYCSPSLIGPVCLNEGSKWKLVDNIPHLDFRAPRSPDPWSLEHIAKSLQKDIHFRLTDYFQRGAGDTYFSGKGLARLARILIITDELKEICGTPQDTKSGRDLYAKSCEKIILPKEADFTGALDSLRSSVEIWINGTAETPFVYDDSWGGVVSCGCLFNDKKRSCFNSFPDCPTFLDPGLDFGNGFYNDQHFHYGYHIYASAVVAKFDPEWGRRFFDQVLLLVRSIANPSREDKYFPQWRHKDWFQGHSWASGIIAPPFLNGKNQESSSESIAAYEAVALYGKSMVAAFEKTRSTEQIRIAKEVYEVGAALAASELRSAKRYYHVRRDDEVQIYPPEYTPHVIGIMWNTMAQFQTWFGLAPYLASGIQLLPLTSISENRDDVLWAKGMYKAYSSSCDAHEDCEASGWSILEYALLATVGHKTMAFDQLRKVPLHVFDGPGGDGHSMTNSIWYIATRPNLENPLPLDEKNATSGRNKTKSSISCNQPDACTSFVLDTIADIYTCRQRITFLMRESQKTELEACIEVAVKEYPSQCGGCNPLANHTIPDHKPAVCPPCSDDQCKSDLNRCPRYKHTFVCSAGANRGGCSASPWSPGENQCSECCELTDCPRISATEWTIKASNTNDVNCPPCSKSVCHSPLNLCPAAGGAPYLCTSGSAMSGCSPLPWSLIGGQCEECCKVNAECLK